MKISKKNKTGTIGLLILKKAKAEKKKKINSKQNLKALQTENDQPS